MAVTGIRKVSSSTLLALVVISIAVIALFFGGGFELDDKGNKVYEFTDTLLWWTYALLGVTILGTLGFALKGFFSSFANDSKKALLSLGGLIGLIALLGITYAIGDGTPMANLNADSQRFNTEGWLKLTDMWLYSTYALFVLVVGAALVGAISKVVKK
ncbi:hypothetical protein [Porphyromonas sp. COT-239 OH1446]|uniref:hypothetical protein n=1 Tax=Porphyromonas sp. COT-239 OH1446 TaxID=1515613 RepID=UPI00052C4C8D|nr:hypothetical protein [Porphyromonas sp. COT-239 OH1446]KGN67707.1 membrane protein [Porphyromonas sp. COT-239 OH1446]